MSPNLIDLFSGCGGMSLGFLNAGFDIIAAYDNWQPAVEVYKRNFSHPIYSKDLSSPEIVDEIRRMNPDIIIGGPPCQDFSIAGKRNFQGSRANLTLSFGSIIQQIRPKWFVMENVYNIEKSPIFGEVIQIFHDAGYGMTRRVFDASLMGVPQKRQRYIVIGKKNAKDDFLKEAIEKDFSEHSMTVREYLGNTLGTDFYYMHPRSYKRRAIFSIDEPAMTIRGVNRPMPQQYSPHPADKTQNISLVRSLTDKERSYLQTFPESYQFFGSKTCIEQMIGNAVPVKMAEYVARHILKAW